MTHRSMSILASCSQSIDLQSIQLVYLGCICMIFHLTIRSNLDLSKA